MPISTKPIFASFGFTEQQYGLQTFYEDFSSVPVMNRMGNIGWGIHSSGRGYSWGGVADSLTKNKLKVVTAKSIRIPLPINCGQLF